METITVLVSLFSVMLTGMVAGQLKLFNDEARKAFSRYVFYIGTSAIVIQSIVALTPAQLRSLPRFTAFNCLFYVLMTLALYIVLRLSQVKYHTGGAILYGGTAANMIYFGLPLVRALYSNEGVTFTLVLFVVPTTLADLTAFYLLSNWRHKGAPLRSVLKDFAQNPLVISAVVGCVLLVLGVHFPTSIDDGLTLLGNTTTGVALFAMGLFLATSSWRHFRYDVAAVASIIKLLAVPAVAIVTARLFGLTGTALAVTVLMAAMPSAVFCIVVATEYGYDERATADTVLLSSVLFVLTSPLWIGLVR